MKKMLFLSVGLLAAMAGFGQTFGTDGAPVISGHPDHASFMAYLGRDNVVQMRWGRSDNDQIDHYVVERSTDSSFFNELDEVVAKPGIDPDSVYYRDADAFPSTHVNYYRLTSFLKDGSSFSTAAVKVDLDPGRTPSLVPSVLHGGETLRMDKNYRDHLMVVDFFTQGGMWIKSYEVNGSSFNINTSGWQPGIYYYRITDEGRPVVDAGKILVL